MIKSILIGLESSVNSESVLELGMRWSKRYQCLLGGIGIVDTPDICKPRMVPIGSSWFKKRSDEDRLQKAREQVGRLLERFADCCLERGVMGEVLESEGSPEEQILLESQRFDLVLLGQRSNFHWATREASSDETLSKVLKISPTPVVAVPPDLSEKPEVLVACDGSLQSARALHSFVATGLGQETLVHLVSVHSKLDVATENLKRPADFAQRHGLEVKCYPHQSSTAPGEVLIDLSNRLNVGMMVMGCYGQPTIREFFLGSVTRTVLRECTVPVFLFH